MHVILVCSNHRHVSAIHVDIFKLVNTRYNYSYSVCDTLYLQLYFVLTDINMAT